MQAIAPAASISTEILADAPPLQDQGGAAQELVFSLCGHTHGDVVPYAAEAGQFQERSEEHTSELQSLMRISYAVFCLKKKITSKIILEHSSKQTTRSLL